MREVRVTVQAKAYADFVKEVTATFPGIDIQILEKTANGFYVVALHGDSHLVDRVMSRARLQQSICLN